MQQPETIIKSALLAVLLVLGGTAAAESLYYQGRQAYDKGNYPLAAQCYEQILDQGLCSSEVYYNLGNAYYRCDEMGRAILNYERALRLRPRDTEAQQNLDLANSKIEDCITPLPQLFVVRWFRSVAGLFSPRGWFWVCLLLLCLAGACIAWFCLAQDYRARKASFIVSAVAVLLFAYAAVHAGSAAFGSRQDAIVMESAAEVKSSPDSNGVDKLLLHEGTKVHIADALQGWYKISIADGNTGWIRQESVTII